MNEESITDLMRRGSNSPSFTGRIVDPANIPDRVDQLEKELEATKIELKILRKEYDNHLVQAVWISGGTVLLFVGLTLLT